jgi:hypothetical protein
MNGSFRGTMGHLARVRISHRQGNQRWRKSGARRWRLLNRGFNHLAPASALQRLAPRAPATHCRPVVQRPLHKRRHIIARQDFASVTGLAIIIAA